MNTVGTQRSIQFGLPPLDAFWVSADQPQKIPRSFYDSPEGSRTLLRPFHISPATYSSSLDLQVPMTFMIGYVTIVLLLNRLNASRKHKPWAFSKTSLFKKAVILHNASLALFSAWMFGGICYSVYTSWPAGAAQQGADYYAHVAQMFCETDSSAIRAPSSVKSLWEEGCAYFGWFFYVSKYYEVLDTLVILSSGKKSSTLQTYHHTGVMICAWASLKYASPAYLIGVFLNSGIHTLMYSYFAIRSAGFHVPMAIKRAITSVQITQFVVGVIWGWVYVFVTYDLGSIMAEQTFANNSSELEAQLALSTPNGAFGVGTGKVSANTAVSCLSDRGEALGSSMSTLYVLPLMYLFVQFFIRSYVKVKK